MSAPPRARFTPDEGDGAAYEWGFNCGPGALCLLFGLTPDEVRPHLDGFERKGYTNPTLMYGALRSLGKIWTWKRLRPPVYPKVGGIVRMQWGGPWCAPGVPPRVAYRNTHWIASWHDGEQLWFGDVNAIVDGGWLPDWVWGTRVAPWLIQCEARGDGLWWPTHILEVIR